MYLQMQLFSMAMMISLFLSATECFQSVSVVSEKEFSIKLPGDVSLVLVSIPAGKCMMGRYGGEQDSLDNEEPQHEVHLTQEYYIGKHEVTQAQWRAMMDTRPSYFTGDNLPVEQVSWEDVQGFMKTLNLHLKNTGQGLVTVRLPSEAEWEYACRAGTATRFFWGDNRSHRNIGSYAWYDGNSNGMTHSTGDRLANDFELYDMSGNVWEWCEDDWHDNYEGAPIDGSAWVDIPRGLSRVIRGGSWSDFDWVCRSAIRTGYNPAIRLSSLGFRVAAVVLSDEAKNEPEPEVLQDIP